MRIRQRVAVQRQAHLYAAHQYAKLVITTLEEDMCRMRVDVYRNLHKDCMSVRSREKGDYGKVIRHTRGLKMSNVDLIVRQKGRQNVIATKRKNVHAFLRGVLRWTYVEPNCPLVGMVELTYNPYISNEFYERSTGRPVHHARQVIVKENKVYANGLLFSCV